MRLVIIYYYCPIYRRHTKYFAYYSKRLELRRRLRQKLKCSSTIRSLNYIQSNTQGYQRIQPQQYRIIPPIQYKEPLKRIQLLLSQLLLYYYMFSPNKIILKETQATKPRLPLITVLINKNIKLISYKLQQIQS